MDHEFTIDGRPDLDIRIRSGRVIFMRGDQGAVRVSVDTEDPDFTVEQRGKQIHISSGQSTRRWSSPTAHVAIELPDLADVLVHTASANVDSKVAFRRADFKSASGKIQLTDVEDLYVKTASGDVTAANVSGSTRIDTASGDVRITGSAGGTVVIHSVSGDVRIEDTDANLEVSTVSGRTHIGRFVGKVAGFKSVSGDVEFGVPPGTKADLDTDMRTGRLVLPSTPPPTTEVHREMKVKAKSISGDLVINRVPA